MSEMTAYSNIMSVCPLLFVPPSESTDGFSASNLIKNYIMNHKESNICHFIMFYIWPIFHNCNYIFVTNGWICVYFISFNNTYLLMT
jgi:hypothetical protein